MKKPGYTNTIHIPCPDLTPEQVQAICDEINEMNRHNWDAWMEGQIEMLEAQIDTEVVR